MPLDYKEFAKKIKNKYPEYSDVDDLTLSKKMVDKYPEYKNEVYFETPLKKKEVSQSTSKQELTSSVTSKTAQKQPSVSSVNKNNALPGEYLYYEGKGTRRYDDGKWYDYGYSEDRNGKQVDIYDKQITDPTRVNTLNKHFGKVGSTSANEDVFTGYPGQEKNQYRVIEDKWQKKMPGQEKWRIVTNEGSIQSLNKEFKKNVSTPSNLEELKKQQEEDIIKDKKLNSSLTWVNSGLIGSEEDEASEILKKKFPGFDFIKQGALTDELLVVAPNGARANISLDNWTDEDDRKQSTVLREFIKNNSDEKLVKSANDLRLKESQERTFIEDQKKQSLEAGVVAQDWKWDNGKLIIETPLDKAKKSQEYQDIKSGLKESRKEYMSSKAQQFDDIYYRFKDQPKNNEEMIAAYASVKADNQEIKRVNDYVNDIKNNSNDFKKEKSNIESYTNSAILKLQSGEITQEEFDSEYKPEIEKRVSDLNEKSKSLSNELKTIGTVDNSINQSVAKNYLIKEATGSFVGGVASKFINGFTYLPKLASMGDMSKKDQEDIVNLITGGGTTKEYMESGERSDVSKALFSMSESLGILASSAILGGTTAYPSFYAQSYYEMKDELDSIPQMSETEKVIMSGAYGVISSALEKFGIDAVTQKTKIGKNLTNNIIKGIFTDLPKNASKEFIDAAISNNIKKYVVKSGLQAAIGAGSEGITESLQNLTSVGVKELYDLAKGTEYFNNKSAWNILGDAVYEGWLGALGGGVMSTVTSSVDVIKNGVSSTLNKEQINTLINSASVEGIDSALLTNLKSSILTGKITSDEAKDINDSFHLIKSKLNSLPDNMSTDDKSVSLDLLIERDKLQKESSRLDEALRAPYNNRIAEINNKLLNISENAVKESTKPVEEVAAEGGGVQYQGVEQGQPEVREGEGPVGETEKPETDLGNRPIESRGVEEEVVLPTDEIGRSVGSQEYRSGVSQKKGRTITRTAPDGTKIKGAFKIVPASELVPSHNPNTFSKNEAFPQNKEGRTINDRDYETDKPAQSQVIDIAQNIDERAVTQTPIVSKEGIVYDGNNRTMSRQLAAQNKTDQDYLQALRDQADMYGLTEEDVNAVENPTLVFEVEENLPFDTKTMAMFNKQEKKAQGPLQRAVAISKRISDTAKRSLAGLYEGVEVPSDVTSDPKNMKQAIDILVQEGLIQTVEIPRYIDKGVATPDGVSFLEGVVMAASLNEDSIRELSVPGMGDIKKVILKNVVGLMQNSAKGNDSLTEEITGAIQIIQKAKAAKISVEDYLSQYDMFKENQYTIGEMSMALLLDTKKPTVFKNFLANYNENVGVENIFGEDTSKEAILNNTISTLINDYGKIKENLESIAAERGKQVSESIEETQSIEEVKDLDVTDKTNLQKVKSFLDKLEDDLDKFGKETLGVNLPVAAMKLIIKALKVSVQAGMTLEQAIKDYAKKNNIDEKRITDSLYSMSDFQTRKTRERITGEKQPTVKISKEAKEAKEISKRKVTKVAIKDEYKAMITQIKLEAKAAREAKADLNSKRKMLAAAISGMVKTGKMKASQAAVLVKRVSSLNLDNPVMVERFTNYAQRVFERADYQQRLDDAFAIRKSIRKALKTDNQAEVVGMAKEFTKIDPSLVEDIDAYMEIAEKVKNAVKPSRVKGLDVVMKESANIAEISEYTNEEIARQEQIKIDELLAIHDYLEDISKDMSLKEIQDVINLLKENPDETVDKEAKVKEFLKNRFDFMAGIIDTMFKTGVDPMTGEEITFDDKQKDLMKRVLKIDLNEMSTREAIKIVEGVDNFLNNQITSSLEAAASSYEGATNSKQLVNKGTKAKSLRLFFSNYVGKIYSEQLFSLPMLMEKMFDGVTNSIDVMSKMGLVKLINGVNKANRQHNEIIDEYSKQGFYKSKDFMDADNVYERGMLAFLKRNLVGNPTEMKAEFERRVRMVQESINKLIEDGDAKEQKMGEIYQKIYDKLGVAEMDMDVINSNASKNNLDAVNWWVNQWSQHYSDLSDISLSVYNTQLGSDLNYTPDKYKRLSSENQSLDEGAVEKNGAFAITIDYTDKKKTGVLMETTRPNFMPDGRYISLDFDTNNSKALKSALIDINTAAAIRQVDGFINSKSFKKLIPESEDRSIMTKRINTYIRRAKGKNIVPSDTIQYINKLTNYITSLGVGKALGGISQAVSQTIPVIVNTVVNSGRFDVADAKFNTWLNKTGLPISNRGLESQSTVESIDRKIDMTGTKTQEALKKIADLNQWYLKQFLVRPDVFVARSSFKSYYLQNLKRRGLSTDIDWTTHEIDMEAAEYAQAMIDRQQNISDSMLAGEFLASDDPIKQITRKVVLPFASFILNQKARMYNDLNTIFSETSTREDKAIAGRSLTGLAAELVTYQLIGFGIRRLYDTISASLLGDEDDEETKKKKLINATKYPIKSIVNDIVSPIPMADGIVTWGLNQALAQYPWMNDKEIKDAIKSRNKVLELKGEPSMTESEEKEFIDKIKEEATYQVFEDDFDRSYGMIGIVGSTYQELGEIGKLSTTGEFTDEYQGRETTKKLLEADREKVKYAVPFMIAYSTGLLPKDVGTISKNYINRIKKKAVTEKQYDRYETVQKDLGRNLKSWEIDMVKDKKESETAIDEIKFIERNGGLTERQGREYLKLMKAIGEPTVSDLTKIKNGQTADQILK